MVVCGMDDHRCGKQSEGEKLVSEPTSRDQNTRQEWGQGKGDKKEIYKEDEVLGAQTEVARQSRAPPPATK